MNTGELRMAAVMILVLLGLGGGSFAVAQGEQKKPDQTIHIIAERFSFTPSRIKVKQGTTVELVLRSDDTTHGFRIPKLGVDRKIDPRGEIRVVIEAREAGEYAFECSRPCGAGHNMMRGVLIIE